MPDAVNTMSLDVYLRSERLREPRLEVSSDSPREREIRAALYMIAAHVEMETPARESWTVRIADGNDHRGRVFLALAGPTAAEARRGVAVLRRVRQAFQMAQPLGGVHFAGLPQSQPPRASRRAKRRRRK